MNLKLQMTVDDKIFAMGDCAACPMKDNEHNVPPRAQAVHPQVLLLLKSITCMLKNKPLPEYAYGDFDSLVSLSENSAVGNLRPCDATQLLP